MILFQVESAARGRKMERGSYEAAGVLEFMKAEGIRPVKWQESAIGNSKTISRQMAKEMLGSHFDAFSRWYEETYLRRDEAQIGFVSSVNQAMAEQNMKNEFLMEPVNKTGRRERDKALRIADQVYRKVS